MKNFPGFYAIADADVLERRETSLPAFANALRSAGTRLLQYRDKTAPPQTILRNAAILSSVFTNTDSTLIMNDRADLALFANFNGVHVGQDDLPPEDARTVLESNEGPSKIVGISTHTDAQVIAANTTSADYIAIGPIFATGTKLDAEPVVGLEGLRRARALTAKPLVAIGGITRHNARSVIAAGADSVAVISALFAPGESVEKVARDFIELLR